jgi:hypothetical protein
MEKKRLGFSRKRKRFFLLFQVTNHSFIQEFLVNTGQGRIMKFLPEFNPPIETKNEFEGRSPALQKKVMEAWKG